MSDRFLPIYLNDHLAGSVVGVELAKRARANNAGTPLDDILAEVCSEIEADRRVLRELMESLGIAEDRVKPAAAWLSEKVGRLKPNGQLRGYSPLSRVVELEALQIGVSGKRLLWRALGRAYGNSLDGFDFKALEARAEGQLQKLEACRLEAVTIAFGGE